MLERTELIPVHDGERRTIGPFDCEFIPVTHSVPHALRDRVPHARGHDPAQRRLQARPHAGRRPQDRPRRCWARSPSATGGVQAAAVRLDQRGRPGFTPSESTVGDTMRVGVPRAIPNKRFIVASFASHLHRVQQVAEAAIAHGRKVAFLGRSMVQQRRARPRDGHARHPRQQRHRHRRGAALRAGRGVHHLHRLAGRADERALADGRARAQAREDQQRRRRRDLARTRSPATRST